MIIYVGQWQREFNHFEIIKSIVQTSRFLSVYFNYKSISNITISINNSVDNQILLFCILKTEAVKSIFSDYVSHFLRITLFLWGNRHIYFIFYVIMTSFMKIDSLIKMFTLSKPHAVPLPHIYQRYKFKILSRGSLGYICTYFLIIKMTFELVETYEDKLSP